MLGISAFRAISTHVKAGATSMIEFPKLQHGAMGNRSVSFVSSAPVLVRMSEHPIESKGKDGKDVLPNVNVGDEGVVYVPANVPLAIASGQRVMYVRALDKDGIFCAAPMVSI